MKKKYLVGIITVILLILAGFFAFTIIKHSSTSLKNPKTTQVAPLPKEVTITLSKDGFKPSQVTIKKGTAVRWKNESSSQQTVNSDNYPTNQLHRELNFGVFNNGSSVVYTFTKPGEYGFHNQFKPKQTGKIIVLQ